MFSKPSDGLDYADVVGYFQHRHVSLHLNGEGDERMNPIRKKAESERMKLE